MSIENPTAGWGKIRWKALQDFPPFTTLSGANTLKNTSFATGSDKIHLDLIRCQRQAPVPIATFRAENERRQLCWYLNKIWLLLTWQSYGTEPHKAQHFSSEAAWGSIECFRMFSRFFAEQFMWSTGAPSCAGGVSVIFDWHYRHCQIWHAALSEFHELEAPDVAASSMPKWRHTAPGAAGWCEITIHNPWPYDPRSWRWHFVQPLCLGAHINFACDDAQLVKLRHRMLPLWHCEQAP